MTRIFDYEASLVRMGYDEALFREMVDLLGEDGPARMRQVWQGLKNRDAQGVLHAAHTLKGLAANFGAEPTMEASARLEGLARQERWSEIEAGAETLEHALDELLRALRPLAVASKSV